MYRHFAWFDRTSGDWLREWTGDVPDRWLAVPPCLVGDGRTMALNARLQALVPMLGVCPCDGETVSDAWDHCEPYGAVCLDVTRFNWPLGDHVWHRWIEADRLLEWGEEHHFLEIDLATGRIAANVYSHRPVRSTAQRLVVDVTHTALAGRGDMWGSVRRPALLTEPDPTLDLVADLVVEQEPVYVRQS